MIHELRIYTLHPGKQSQFIAHVGEVGLAIRGAEYGRLEGYWTSEFGTLNQVFHLWSFPSLEERRRLLSALHHVEPWGRDYLPKARGMIQSQEATLISSAVPMDPPTDAPNIYELRRYTLYPGKISEWLQLFKRAAPARQKLSRIVGVWTSELGVLNQVIHMWAYRDLKERTSIRSQAISDHGWHEFVARVAPLLMHMEATILNPVPFSPLK